MRKKASPSLPSAAFLNKNLMRQEVHEMNEDKKKFAGIWIRNW